MIDSLLNILSSEPTLTIIGSIIAAGSPIIWKILINRVQTIECYYIESRELETIPIVNQELQKTLHSQVYIVKNTSNKDLSNLEIVFKFGNSSVIQKCYKIYNNNSVAISSESIDKNKLQDTIRVLNREDEAEYRFTNTNIFNEDICCVEILNIAGVKIKCIDKRKRKDRSNTFSIN